jgi:hypothetical protein
MKSDASSIQADLEKYLLSDPPSPNDGLRGLVLACGPEMAAAMRKTLLRGSMMEWWSVVRDDIEGRTARAMFAASWRRQKG